MYRLMIALLLGIMVAGCGGNKDQAITDDNRPQTVAVSQTDHTLIPSAEFTNWEAKRSAEPADTVVTFRTDVDGCSCSRHSELKLLWDSPIVADSLRSALIDADRDGLFLCDCKHGNGENLRQIIESVEYYVEENSYNGKYAGFKIKLKEEVWLYRDDISPRLEQIVSDHRVAILNGRGFNIN